jgi:hypothetical protein
MASCVWELALFKLGFDSKLCSCDLVAQRVKDISLGDMAADRTTATQRETHPPFQFEIIQATPDAGKSAFTVIVSRAATIYSLAEFTTRFTSGRGNTRAFCNVGLTRLVWIQQPTARSRCGDLRLQ